MTALRALDRAVDLAPGDHVSWAYGDLRGLRRVCVETFAEGAARGEQLVYIGDTGHGGLWDDLADLDGRDELRESGRLRVHDVSELYQVSGSFVPQLQVETFRAEAQRAVREGYAGLRVVGDVTGLVAHDTLWPAFVDYELSLEAMYAVTPVLGICVFDRTRVGERWREVSCLHRIQHIAGGEPTFALTCSTGVVRLAGEVDAGSVDELRRLLDAVLAATTGMLELNLADLTFLDVAGARVLAQVRDRMASEGRQLLLTGVCRSAGVALSAFDLKGGAQQ